MVYVIIIAICNKKQARDFSTPASKSKRQSVSIKIQINNQF